MKSGTSSNSSRGFTIVELLVVIVVIGILAAITIVSYTGVAQRATVAALQSDLNSNSNILKIYNVEYDSYPTTLNGNCPLFPVADTKYCLKPSSSDTFTYKAVSPKTFHLTGTIGTTSYSITDSNPPAVATTPASCPTNFIPVPGSGTYGTNDFCVMKYEAKNVSGVATSQPALTPWVYISQNSAITTAAAACTGCHLITEAEWLTIAQNVMSVSTNWSSGTVGTGFIYSGHNDNAPANSLAAYTDDTTYPWYGETNTGGWQRRTLTLTNGQVIWDLAGNVMELTSGTTSSGQPGIVGNNYSSWIEWPNVTTYGSLSPNPFPITTGITGASSWDDNNGIGMLQSSTTDNSARAFVRGGHWNNGAASGVLTLGLYVSPSQTNDDVGFRVSR